MAERTLNEELSGAEIKTIILRQIEDRLEGDSTLLDDIAYAGFSVSFTITISYVRSLTKPTEVWGNASSGEMEGERTAIQMKGEYKTQQPDVARQEHNLEIPVLAQTPNGPERKKVRIERKK